jgi:predicted tellurium resistance membrane protein TerC
MNQGTTRSILRWIHVVFSIPIIGYVYSPFEEIPNYAPAVRFLFLPLLVLTGLWMWKGHALRRLISKGSPGSSMVARSESLMTQTETD